MRGGGDGGGGGAAAAGLGEAYVRWINVKCTRRARDAHITVKATSSVDYSGSVLTSASRAAALTWRARLVVGTAAAVGDRQWDGKCDVRSRPTDVTPRSQHYTTEQRTAAQGQHSHVGRDRRPRLFNYRESVMRKLTGQRRSHLQAVVSPANADVTSPRG